MRLATFNVENLFARARALKQATPGEPNPALKAFERFNETASLLEYKAEHKASMLEDLRTLKVLIRNQAGDLRLSNRPFDALALLRENRGDFLRQPKKGSVEIVANGRAAWIGWLELTKDPVDDTAIQMTARLIESVDADVQAVIEAEDRPALVRFNSDVLNDRFRHVMLIDGNDQRGIDVGLLAKSGFPILSMTSHVDDPDPDPTRKPKGAPLFSRDCPVYRVGVGKKQLCVLVNHLKSQSFTAGDPDPLRTRQSQRVRAIYDQVRAQGPKLVAVVGDLNKGPVAGSPVTHPTLEALLGPGTPLIDVQSLNGFDEGPRPGTFQSCSLRNRLDYILVSPELANHFVEGGINRQGLWGDPGNKNPPSAWTIFPPITAPVHQASDHAAVWARFDL